MGKYILIFLSPVGRVPQHFYAYFAIPLMIALLVVTRYIDTKFLAEDDPPSAWLLVPLIALYWMHASISSRRLHDCGWTGLLAPAFAAVLVYQTASRFFPDTLLGYYDDVRQQSQFALDVIATVAIWGYRLTCVLGLAKDGESGANVFGPPFGTMSEAARRRKDERRWERLKHDIADQRLPSEPAPNDVVHQYRPAKSARATPFARR